MYIYMKLPLKDRIFLHVRGMVYSEVNMRENEELSHFWIVYTDAIGSTVKSSKHAWIKDVSHFITECLDEPLK